MRRHVPQFSQHNARPGGGSSLLHAYRHHEGPALDGARQLHDVTLMTLVIGESVPAL